MDETPGTRKRKEGGRRRWESTEEDQETSGLYCIRLFRRTTSGKSAVSVKLHVSVPCHLRGRRKVERRTVAPSVEGDRLDVNPEVVVEVLLVPPQGFVPIGGLLVPLLVPSSDGARGFQATPSGEVEALRLGAKVLDESDELGRDLMNPVSASAWARKVEGRERNERR